MAKSLRSILLVEDNPLDVELTLTELTQYRLSNDVDIARDGEEAMDYLQRRGRFASRRPEQPAVVLLDLMLPKVDGVEVLEQIKNDPELENIPVVVLTTSREGPLMERCKALGVEAYLTKPVHFHALIDTLVQLGLVFAIHRDGLPIFA